MNWRWLAAAPVLIVVWRNVTDDAISLVILGRLVPRGRGMTLGRRGAERTRHLPG